MNRRIRSEQHSPFEPVLWYSHRQLMVTTLSLAPPSISSCFARSIFLFRIHSTQLSRRAVWLVGPLGINRNLMPTTDFTIQYHQVAYGVDLSSFRSSGFRSTAKETLMERLNFEHLLTYIEGSCLAST